MTLIEMLLAMIVFLIVTGAALKMVVGQSRGYRVASGELATGTSLRFGADALAQELRAAGANVADDQPEAVYASGTVFAFNADYVSNVANDIAAAYVDEDAPDDQVQSLPVARKVSILGSSPSFVYPSQDYDLAGVPSSAETITFAFIPDTSSARADDYMLVRRVNDQPAELLLRGVLQNAGQPFFSYQRVRNTGTSLVLDSVPTAWLPLRHSAAVHGGPADTAVARRIDSLRVVRLSYAISNGQPGTDERIRPITTMIPLPNLGLVKLKSCGDEPIFGKPLAAVATVVDSLPAVSLSWAAATDETAGEHDVMRYVIWRRLITETDWGAPYLSLPSGNATYEYTDPAVESGLTYVYAIAAQDCTPQLSSRSISAAVTIP
jgi:type II secretory pathway pseudopilin PulG